MTRKGALIGLLLVNRKCLTGGVAISGCHDHIDHEVVVFKIFGNKRKANIKLQHGLGERRLQTAQDSTRQ